MSTLVLSAPFNFQTFNNLPHYNDAKLFVPSSEALIYQYFYPLIKKHGLSSLVSVCLLHKHFDLNDGEVLLENINSDESAISPQNSSVSSTPYMWKAEGNEFVPLEFLEYSPELAAKIKRVECAPAFLEEFYQLLIQLKVHFISFFLSSS